MHARSVRGFSHGIGMDALPHVVCVHSAFAFDLCARRLIAITPFTFATWEEYYTGKLILPVLNGPTDGVLICIFTTIVVCSVVVFLVNSAFSTCSLLFILDCSERLANRFSLRSKALCTLCCLCSRSLHFVDSTEGHPLCLLLLFVGVFALIPTLSSKYVLTVLVTVILTVCHAVSTTWPHKM